MTSVIISFFLDVLCSPRRVKLIMTPLRVCYIQYYNLNLRLLLSCELKDKLNLTLLLTLICG